MFTAVIVTRPVAAARSGPSRALRSATEARRAPGARAPEVIAGAHQRPPAAAPRRSPGRRESTRGPAAPRFPRTRRGGALAGGGAGADPEALAAPKRGVGADVRRQRPRAPRLVPGRPRRVDEALGALDLLGVGDAVLSLLGEGAIELAGRMEVDASTSCRPPSAPAGGRALRRSPPPRPARPRAAPPARVEPLGQPDQQTPVSASPAISARSIGAAPRQRGSRTDGR